VLYAKDVEAVAAFYIRLGFRETARLPGPWGERVAFVTDPEGNVVSLAAGR
jgi:hypothetical protein